MYHGGSMHHGGHLVGHTFHSLLRHAKDLGLSDEQRTQIKTIATDYVKTHIREKAAMKLAEVDVRTLVHNEKADLSAIETAIKKSESTHATLRFEEVKAMRAAVAVLTPEQREKWRTLGMERHGGRPGEGHGERHGEHAQSRAYGEEPLTSPHEDAQPDEDTDERMAFLHDFPGQER